MDRTTIELPHPICPSNFAQMLASLADGGALAQHMEDSYLITLKECVLAANPQLRGSFQRALEEALPEAVAEGEQGKQEKP